MRETFSRSEHRTRRRKEKHGKRARRFSIPKALTTSTFLLSIRLPVHNKHTHTYTYIHISACVYYVTRKVPNNRHESIYIVQGSFGRRRLQMISIWILDCSDQIHVIQRYHIYVWYICIHRCQGKTEKQNENILFFGETISRFPRVLQFYS